jgi:DNA-nicking Smr family endonuclease
MSRRKKEKSRSNAPSNGSSSASQGFYTPFKNLDQHLEPDLGRRVDRGESRKSQKPTAVSALPRETSAAEDAAKLFMEAMVDVQPLGKEANTRIALSRVSKKPPRFLALEDLEAYTKLVDLVAGGDQFELSYSDEYVDGAVVGLSPQIMKKLRKGEFSYRDYIDLHGQTREEARQQVIQFVRKSFATNHRCVLIVCGRGLNSADKEPILKNALVKWLTRAPLKRLVLAFSSARAHDGGAGAFYVLLRRNEGKAKFAVPAK